MSSSKFEQALSAIDAAHAEDPNKITIHGRETAYELHYAQKMSHYLTQREPAASEELRLAIRAQHLRRWEVSRSSYPMTKLGYHSWRTFLKKRQAELAAGICRQCGYSEEECERIAGLIRKENLKSDEETQVLEDVACLVFLDDQFEEFERAHDEEKIVAILRKTWGKMSDRGHQLALQIEMSERTRGLVEKALGGS
jgi:hypothetical protein